jgi:Mg-chelatase subunit ChlI
LAQTLGWQEPCKVDVYTIKRTTDLFGSDAAVEGSTLFRRSSLLDYVERAHVALREGLDTQFLVLLDELNRVHAKSNESMHGLFDDTRQVTVTTTEGSKTIKLPPNIHFIGTMNAGAEYLGTHELDEALKDRFAPVKLTPMPPDYEVRKLVAETHVLEVQATAIVQVAGALRQAANTGQIGYSPSYRACRNAARLLRNSRGKGDLDLRMVIVKSFLGWYAGALDGKGEPVDANSEVAKAYAALRMKGVAPQVSKLKESA